MTEFTPLSATLGGLLIGLAATLLLLLNGRVAGISGILGRALAPSRGDFAWRVTFLIGLPLGSGLVAALGGGSISLSRLPLRCWCPQASLWASERSSETAAPADTESADSHAARLVL